MLEKFTMLMENKIFLQTSAIFGFLLLGLFVYFYFSKEGRDERGRGLIATASFSAFVILFIVLNIYAYFLPWFNENIIRLANGIQWAYNFVLLTAVVMYLILKKIG